MNNLSVLESSYLRNDRRIEALENTIAYLKSNREEIRDILTEISTYQTAEEEINTSIQALQNASNEMKKNQPPNVSQMSVFMPSNLILYSYVLYLLNPSLFVDEIEFRSSSLVKQQVIKLHSLLKEVHQLPIHLLDLSHRKYVRDSALNSEVVLFTGSYQNAESIKFQLSEDQVFLYFGQGVNPFIVTPSADYNKAINDVIQARMYNTGQDCMGPDTIYVHSSIIDQFIQDLVTRIQHMRFGANQDPKADYGSIHYISTLESVGQYLNYYSDHIRYGGNIDFCNKVIQPTVLESTIQDKNEVLEFFSPVFNVISYDTNEELKNTFQKGYFLERAMGATVYGDDDSLISFLQRKHVVSVNKTLFDIEDGNEPFGGYGPMANYAAYKNELYIKPLLLSKVLNEIKENEQNV